MSNQERYAQITNELIAMIESDGLQNWLKGWKGNNSLIPINHKTRKAYRGANIFLCWMHAANNNFRRLEYATFNQIRDLGGKVTAGSHGTPIIYYEFKETPLLDPVTKEQLRDSKGRPRFNGFPILKSYYVFNVAGQTDLKLLEEQENKNNPLVECEAIIKNYKDAPAIVEGEPAYNYTRDLIMIPPMGAFQSSEEYYAALFHEATHSTGHESRLKRNLKDIQAMGDAVYSREELIAELGATFLCADAGINPITEKNQAAYLKHWIGQLKENPRILLTSLGAAQKATDYIKGKTGVTE